MHAIQNTLRILELYNTGSMYLWIATGAHGIHSNFSSNPHLFYCGLGM